MIEITAAKLAIALYGGLTAFLFALLFSLAYLYLFRRDNVPLKLFFASGATLFLFLFSKALLSSLRRGYISDRLFFYGLFSPKALGISWLVGGVVVGVLFFRVRERLNAMSAFRFLFSLYVFFVLLSVGVAGIREGFSSVYEPFTRTHWEYTGNLPFVQNASHFLRNFGEISQGLSIHTRIHPPGYTLILYFFQTYLRAGVGGMAVLVVMLGGLTLIPLYYFLKHFLSEAEVRRGLEIFVLFPSVVMMSATSMETTFLFFSWLSIALVYAGWTRNWRLAFLGGAAAGAALFLNFLFLLLLPLFLVLLVVAHRKDRVPWRPLLARTAAGLLSFLLLFTVLYLGTGYSIVRNFFAASAAQDEASQSNFESLSVYATYLLMNLISFSVYLGIPSLLLIAGQTREFLRRRAVMESLGIIMVALFSLIGVFQGEIERIWLFLTPLFILPLVHAVKDYRTPHFNAFLSLLFFQIVIMQVLFYTYW